MRYFVPQFFGSFLTILIVGCSRPHSAPQTPSTPTVNGESTKPETTTHENVIAQTTEVQRPIDIAWREFEDPDSVTYFTHHLEKVISVLPVTEKAGAIRRMHKLLKSDSLKIRRRAALVLGDLGDKSGVPAMIASFPQATGHDRDNIIVALRVLKDERAIPTLMDALDDKSPYVRGIALDALGELKAIIAYDRIVALTKDKARTNADDPHPHWCGTALPAPPASCACYALGALGDQRAVPILTKLLDDGELKHSAQRALDVLKKQELTEAAVREIGHQIAANRHDFGCVHASIRELAALNSTDSRDLLRCIAIGEIKIDNPNLGSWAASNLVKCDKRAGWMLFTSDNPHVLEVALKAVEDQPIDEERMQPLKKCVKHPDNFVRLRAAQVMVNAPSGKLAQEAVVCIGQTLAAVVDIPDVDNLKNPGLGGIAQSVAEDNYGSLFGSLVAIDVDDQTLHELARQQKGRARDTVLLALALRGDKSVRESIVKLAQDLDAGMFRAWAMYALDKIGTIEDLALLRKLSKTDPLIRETGDCSRAHDDPPYYPVRLAAERTIKILEGKFKK